MFSDIRGFSGIAEQLTPEELVRLLNEYLTAMTRLVLDDQGLVDKYIGDAIMAVYGAPLSCLTMRLGHATRHCIWWAPCRRYNSTGARRGCPGSTLVLALIAARWSLAIWAQSCASTTPSWAMP